MGNVFQLSLLASVLGQEVRNTFYYEATVGDPSPTEWTDIADEIRAHYVTHMQALNVDTFSMRGILVRKVNVAGLPSTEYPFTLGAVSGSVATDPLPAQIAMVVSVQGATAKPNRGRTYLAGFAEADLTDGLFQAGVATQAVNFITDMQDHNSGGTNPVSRVSAQWNVSHTQVVAFNGIDAAVPRASLIPATQRRRRIGVGI